MVFASTFDDLAIRIADMVAYREKCGLIVVQHGVRDACGACVFSSPCLAHDGGIPGISTRDRGRRSRQFCIEVHIGGIRVPCLASPVEDLILGTALRKVYPFRSQKPPSAKYLRIPAKLQGFRAMQSKSKISTSMDPRIPADFLYKKRKSRSAAKHSRNQRNKQARKARELLDLKYREYLTP
ncbi:uncharacterized protein [Temnothorax nylanderi]|uniref:uncharacterized protein n=1 Tax=Temnothorax nylanderi TaxID=102681 RepID=UPI003A8AE0DD